MSDRDHIDVQGDCAAATLARAAFALGCDYRADAEALRQHYNAALRRLIQSAQNDWKPGAGSGGDIPIDQWGTLALPLAENVIPTLRSNASASISVSAAPHEPDGPESGPANDVPSITSAEASPPWHSHLDAFYADKPGLSTKTRWSYDQAFRAWRILIGDKPIAAIRRTDLKAFADHLRDRPNARGGRLNHKTIIRSLGHIKTFMAWAVAAGLAEDDRFETVQARSATSLERLADPSRRAFKDDELVRLFRSQIFLFPRNRNDQADAMFLLMAALTGARTEELATAPAALFELGDVQCLDLRAVGRKTGAAPRLVPILPDLVRIGLLDWSREQAAAGYALLQPGPTPRTAAGWSKRLNRYIGKWVSDEAALVLYSLRHSFRQMLRAAAIGDELTDKVFGHSSGKVGAGYGRDLSVQEAKLFVERVRPPVDLSHLWGPQ